MSRVETFDRIQRPLSPQAGKQNMTDPSSSLKSLDHSTYCNFCPGYCCYRLPGSTLFVTAVDISRIARYFAIRDGEVRKRFIEGKNTFKTREDGSCIFLRNGVFNQRCSIHGARPRQCMEFPYGKPCPYLYRQDLLQSIHPRVVTALAASCSDQRTVSPSLD